MGVLEMEFGATWNSLWAFGSILGVVMGGNVVGGRCKADM